MHLVKAEDGSISISIDSEIAEEGTFSPKVRVREEVADSEGKTALRLTTIQVRVKVIDSTPEVVKEVEVEVEFGDQDSSFIPDWSTSNQSWQSNGYGAEEDQ